MEMNDLYAVFQSHPTITTDTRDCPEGAIFFALRGASFNGNAFARQALDAGCAYAVVDDAEAAGLGRGADADGRFILVDDVLGTLQHLATFHRKRLRTPIVQITGTNGKTTTKELVAAVLARKFNVLFTQGNFNNHIGVPKTLLRLRPEHEVAVVETGANHPGEIAALSRIVDADCGLITNVGKAHLGGFGSLEGVIRTKGELFDYLRGKDGAYIFLHADNPLLSGIAGGLPCVKYGRPGMGYDVEGELVACDPFLRFRWRAGGEWQAVDTHLVGAYNLDNMLAAAAVGLRFGVPVEDISQALAAYVPTNNRSELERTDRNELIIDAYNANPTSMKAALENFALIPHPCRMAILGEMAELGDATAEEHRRIVEQLATMQCEAVWLVGQAFAEALREVPLPGKECRVFANVDEVKAALRENPVAGRLILIKGSNSTRLFQLPEYL